MLFLLLLLNGYLYNVDEACSRDAVVVLTIEGCFESGQVFVSEVVTTVIADPVCKGVDAHIAHVVSIHVVEDALGVEVQLVALFVDFGISLDDEAEDGSELLEPGALEKVSLFNGKEVGRVGTARWFLRLQGGNPFVEFDCAILISVDQLD